MPSVVNVTCTPERRSLLSSQQIVAANANEIAFNGLEIPAANQTVYGYIRFGGLFAIVNANAADTVVVRVRLGGIGGTQLLATPAVDPVAPDFVSFEGTIKIATAGTLHFWGQTADTVAPTIMPAALRSQAVVLGAPLSLVVTQQWSAGDVANVGELTDMWYTFNIYSFEVP